MPFRAKDDLENDSHLEERSKMLYNLKIPNVKIFDVLFRTYNFGHFLSHLRQISDKNFEHFAKICSISHLSLQPLEALRYMCEVWSSLYW